MADRPNVLLMIRLDAAESRYSICRPHPSTTKMPECTFSEDSEHC